MKCPNCGQDANGGHYVPPSLGDEGFWACESLNKHAAQVRYCTLDEWMKPLAETHPAKLEIARLREIAAKQPPSDVRDLVRERAAKLLEVLDHMPMPMNTPHYPALCNAENLLRNALEQGRDVPARGGARPIPDGYDLIPLPEGQPGGTV